MEEDNPDQNYGTSERLLVDGNPRAVAYLRFAVANLSAPVIQATLRFWVSNESQDGPAIYAADNGWNEDSVTWNNRPAVVGNAVDDKGAIAENTFVSYDVSAIITGNGDYTVALVSSPADGVVLRSREDLIHPPVLFLTLGAPLPPTETPTPSSVTVAPDADARVLGDEPDANFGSSTWLRSDESPASQSFLRFEIPSFQGDGLTATLRLYVTDETADGPAVYLASNDWTEDGVTWNTRPEVSGDKLDDLGDVEDGIWITMDVTNAVTGPGTYTFALIPTSSDGIVVASRESDRHSPQLLLAINGTFGDVSPTPTEPATATPTDTAVPSTPTDTAVPSTPTDTGTAAVTSTDTDTATETATPVPPTSTPTPTAVPPTHTPTLTPTSTVSASATATKTATPTPTATAGSGGTVTVLAAGDIASCSSSGDESTAKLLDGQTGTVLTLGDNAYESGSAAEFANCYDPSWGRAKGRTEPAVGNHEYNTAGASGYFGYFGAAAGAPDKGYYSFELGGWHLIALNSNCSQVGGCAAGSPQEQWLRADLAAHPSACTLAYWHHPRFSSGQHGDNASVQPLWADLYAAGAELVLNGHDHIYERFAPMNATGGADASYGVREIIAGTGGRSHYTLGTVQPNSEVRNTDTWGVLRLSLSADGYAWQFLPEAGKSFTDSGSGSCHGAPPTGAAQLPGSAPAREPNRLADRPRPWALA